MHSITCNFNKGGALSNRSEGWRAMEEGERWGRTQKQREWPMHMRPTHPFCAQDLCAAQRWWRRAAPSAAAHLVPIVERVGQTVPKDANSSRVSIDCYNGTPGRGRVGIPDRTATGDTGAWLAGAQPIEIIAASCTRICNRNATENVVFRVTHACRSMEAVEA